MFASGYLTAQRYTWKQWRGLIDNRFPRSSVYRVEWDCGDFHRLLRRTGFWHGVSTSLTPLITALAVAPGIAVPALVAASPAIAYNLRAWHKARNEAREAGKHLGTLLSEHRCQPALLGHSLGGALMVSAAKSMASGSQGLDSLHLLGAAVPASEALTSALMAVNGPFCNYYSSNDAVLGLLFRAVERGSRAIGEVGTTEPFVQDVDVSDRVQGHGDYVGNVLLH